MAKIDLDSLSIEELAGLRENATDKLFEKVATRRAELEAELEKLTQYGKPPVKKVESAPPVRSRRTKGVFHFNCVIGGELLRFHTGRQARPHRG